MLLGRAHPRVVLDDERQPLVVEGGLALRGGGDVDLHADNLGHAPLGVLDGRHGEEVPEGRAVFFVVEQTHADGDTGADAVAERLDGLGVGALALQKATVDM